MDVFSLFIGITKVECEKVAIPQIRKVFKNLGVAAAVQDSLYLSLNQDAPSAEFDWMVGPLMRRYVEARKAGTTDTPGSQVNRARLIIVLGPKCSHQQFEDLLSFRWRLPENVLSGTDLFYLDDQIRNRLRGQDGLPLDYFDDWTIHLEESSLPTSSFREWIIRLADDLNSRSIILIGESGTGKNLIAESVWKSIAQKYSLERNCFQYLNAAAIPETLFRSELVGNKKGAYSDANKDRIGAFKLADNGLLVIDEFEALSLPNQAVLLDLISAQRKRHKFKPLGGESYESSDPRILILMNEDIKALVRAKDQKIRGDAMNRAGRILQVPSLAKRVRNSKDPQAYLKKLIHLLREDVRPALFSQNSQSHCAPNDDVHYYVVPDSSVAIAPKVVSTLLANIPNSNFPGLLRLIVEHPTIFYCHPLTDSRLEPLVKSACAAILDAGLREDHTLALKQAAEHTFSNYGDYLAYCLRHAKDLDDLVTRLDLDKRTIVDRLKGLTPEYSRGIPATKEGGRKRQASWSDFSIDQDLIRKFI